MWFSEAPYGACCLAFKKDTLLAGCDNSEFSFFFFLGVCAFALNGLSPMIVIFPTEMPVILSARVSRPKS